MNWISNLSCLFHHSLSDPMGLSSMRISRVRVFKDFFAHMTSGRLIWEMQHAEMPFRTSLVIEAFSASHAFEPAVRFEYAFGLCRNNETTFSFAVAVAQY